MKKLWHRIFGCPKARVWCDLCEKWTLPKSDLIKRGTSYSFRELNAARVEMGQLPTPFGEDAPARATQTVAEEELKETLQIIVDEVSASIESEPVSELGVLHVPPKNAAYLIPPPHIK